MLLMNTRADVFSETFIYIYSKTCLKRSLRKKTKKVFKTNYRLMQVNCIAERSKEHSAIHSTFIKLPSVIKIFVLSILSGCFRQVLLNSKTCVKRPLSKRPQISFHNAGQKYCRVQYFRPSLSYHLSLSYYLSIIKWQLKTGFIEH